MAELILFRTDVGRPLTYTEIDNNFKYVANPWSESRIYTNGMIIYYEVIPDKPVLYKANQTTTEGIFDLSEWTALNANVVNVVSTTESTLANYIANDWQPDSIAVGDYLVTSANAVYLLFQNTGSSQNDYLLLNYGDSSSITNVIISNQSSLADYIVNEWNSSIELGDIVILNTQVVWMLTTGNGSLTTQYIKLNNSSINWADIIGKPSATPSQIDYAATNAHVKNTDTYLDYGGANQITAATLRTHVNNTSIHFTMSSITIDHTVNLTNVGTYTHAQIDSHINNTSIHLAPSAIDHILLLNSGSYTHAQIDSHLTGAVHTHVQIDAHLDAGSYGHDVIDSHINNNLIHFQESDIDHNNLQSIGVYTHAQIDNHINDLSLHASPTSINHSDLIGVVGTIYDHTAIDNHIDDSSIHYTMNQIDHSLIIGDGFYFHYQIDGHIDDSSIHYTLDEIDHLNIANVGNYTHTDIDNFIDNIDSVIIALMPITSSTGANSAMMLNANLVSGDNSAAFGSNNQVVSNNAVVLGGTGNTLLSSATNSIILGGENIIGLDPNTAYATNLSLVNGKLSTNNTTILNWNGETSNSISTEIFLPNSLRYIISDSSTIMFRLDVSAFNSGDSVSKIWEIRGGLRLTSFGTLELVGNSYSSFLISEDGLYDTTYNTTNWSVLLVVDNINKSLNIFVSGEDTKTIKWGISGIMTKTI